MDIFDYMDCEGCENLRSIPGKIGGDPDSCYPPESECAKHAPDDGPCSRMLAAVADNIADGYFDTAFGTVVCSGFLFDRYGNLDWYGREHCYERNIPEDVFGTFEYHPCGYDYWWLPNRYDPKDRLTMPLPYKNIEAVYADWF
jgi:hypothetical protein